MKQLIVLLMFTYSFVPVFACSKSTPPPLPTHEAQGIIEKDLGYPKKEYWGGLLFGNPDGSGHNSMVREANEVFSYLVKNGFVSGNPHKMPGGVTYAFTEKGKQVSGPRADVRSTEALFSVSDLLIREEYVKVIRRMTSDDKTGVVIVEYVVGKREAGPFWSSSLFSKPWSDYRRESPWTERTERVKLRKSDQGWRVER